MSQLPEPPPNVPRIVDVQDPGTGHYVVMVRMPTQLAVKYPDKPWGTAIEAIGLAKQDSDRFPGYTLVDVEPLKGSPDLYWIFQKLDGPTWTTLSKGQDSLVPAKYRRLVTTTRTKQEVVPSTQPSAITGDLAQSIVEQQDDTGKAVKVNTSETIAVDGTPLAGQLTDQWGVNTTSESLVAEGTAVTSGFGTKSSRVVPLGNGKSIKETESYPEDSNNDGVIYTLTEEDTDALTGVPIAIQKSLVNAAQAESIAAALRASGWFTEIKSLDKWHSILVASKMSATITGITQTWTETRNISLPNILDEVGVIWDSDSDGEAGSAGVNNIATIEAEDWEWGVKAEANVSVVVSGRPYTKIRQGYSGPAEVTVVRTFHLGPPISTVTPYKPNEVYGTLTIYGAQKNASASSGKSGKGDVDTNENMKVRSHQDNNMAIHFFGPIVHSGTTLTTLGDSPIVAETKTASGGSTPGGGFYPTAVASASLTGVATLSLPSSSAPLSTGATFVQSVDPSFYKLGYWTKEVRTAKVP